VRFCSRGSAGREAQTYRLEDYREMLFKVARHQGDLTPLESGRGDRAADPNSNATVTIAGIDRERRRVAGCFSGLGRPRTGEGLQQCPAPGLGETRWETDNAGSEGARTTGETASQRQEPSTVCGYPGGICSHRGPSGGPNEEERELTLAEDAAPKTSSIGLP
jgi:hypothetical protein